ncbi:MAG: hypothetical protein JJU29_18380 [Verrucomicrobia bacterium]|nr:hypothetical protein [Verrucomicrobiota bacterium]MCH8513948.1 hypothetical protein [Kiritimatiellia bacterium]
MKKISRILYYAAALISPVIFAGLLINHEQRILLFIYVILTTLLFLFYARTYESNGKDQDFDSLPNGKEETIIFYTGGLFQLFAIAQPFTVLISLRHKFAGHQRGFVPPDISVEHLGKALFWTIVFFMIGRTLVAIFEVLKHLQRNPPPISKDCS